MRRTKLKNNVKTILVLVDGMHSATHLGVARAAHDFGWYLDWGYIEGSGVPDRFCGDGVLCALTNDPEMERFVRCSEVPVVDISINRSEVKLPRVVADHPAIGKIAAEHLLEFGHRNFAWFSFERDAVSRARLEGFQKKLNKPVIRLDGEFARNRGRMAEKLKALPKPCAVFARRDSDAAWLLSLCREEGCDVPGEIAVLGVDNNPLICEYLQVPLSSVNHDLERLGYEAARLLDELINGKEPPKSTRLIRPQGVTVRASTNSFAVLDEPVRDALIYMKNHLSRSLGTMEVADCVGLTRRMLEIRFRAATGKTVHQKMIELRLSAAEQLLRSSALTVEDISAQCGFCHAQHLSRLFKFRYGLPPLKYRKSLS
ncbi:AraC family transcriptional regulator [Pontiella agarivorans]|uniref:Substrate-binding domain-containing protein n=1 Tax=Pontiella agarivorans TaxID=3038953 RepID=A0ABU5N280_9BACT|nr:substrate-binding domain-containing protein [Pontiella agarivorans]MDZ8120542.1 substrate-binding domain-containing protein [Pontiella agarivorans]